MSPGRFVSKNVNLLQTYSIIIKLPLFPFKTLQKDERTKITAHLNGNCVNIQSKRLLFCTKGHSERNKKCNHKSS